MGCKCGKPLVYEEIPLDRDFELYDELSEAVYHPLVTRQPIGRWIPNQELSTTRTAVYEAHGHCIIAFRGTDLQSGQDWKNNFLLAVGLNRLTVQYKRDKRLVKTLLRRYLSLTLTGHSRGGRVAIDLARYFNLPATVFNPGTSCCDCMTFVVDRCYKSCCPHSPRVVVAEQIFIHRTQKDIVSLLAVSSLTTQTVNRDGHGIRNF